MLRPVTVCVPPSKSWLQRALVCASLARGTTHLATSAELPGEQQRAAAGSLDAGGPALRHVLDAGGWPLDALRARELVGAVGAGVIRGAEPGTLAIEGRPQGWRGARLALGESGTLARLATACAALAGEPGARFELVPEGTLRARTSPALCAALGLEGAAGFARDLTARGRAGPSSLELRAPGSSQEVTALLVALAALGGERSLRVRGAIPSRPYVDLTCRVLERFGVAIEERSAAAPTEPVTTFVVRGPLTAPRQPLAIEPDASSAAVALAAGSLLGLRARVPGLTLASPQGDVRVIACLRAFGCAAGDELEPPALWVAGRPSSGVALDLADTPDLAPIVAALALRVALERRASSRLLGLATLPHKESSRIAVLARGLMQLGVEVHYDDQSLALAPVRDAVQRAPRAGAVPELDPAGDHRMAFAFALATLGPGVPRATIVDRECVAKSWPSFWDSLAALRACSAAST